MTVTFNEDGLMDSVTVDGQTMPLRQSLMWYAGMGQGKTGNYFDDRASGAYVLRPNGTDAMDIAARVNITAVHTGVIASHDFLLIENDHFSLLLFAIKVRSCKRCTNNLATGPAKLSVSTKGSGTSRSSGPSDPSRSSKFVLSGRRR